MDDVGILIVDDDVASQRALKNVLDSEGWRVRIVPKVSEALNELAASAWNLVVINVALADPRGPLFAILKELAEAEPVASPLDAEKPPKRIRALYLVPVTQAKDMQPVLEREGLPYSLKPYHLNDFLEKVSDLLVEAGAIAEPIRVIGGGFHAVRKRRRSARAARDGRRGTMFASREDYQMTDEEMAEYEREEEESRKRREKELQEMKDRGGHS